jgi:GT2 family glycosyltransferase
VDYRVIVVDNGSGSKTRDYLATKDVEVVRLNENRGFVRGTNAGLERVRDGEDVLLLNDDVCVVDPGWLSKLASLLVDDVGAVGPTSNFVMGSQSMVYFPEDLLPVVHEAKFLVGFCMLIRSDVFSEVGVLDERFGMGGCDDMDYSIRVRRAGFRMLVNRNSFLFHWGSMSIKRFGSYGAIEARTR